MNNTEKRIHSNPLLSKLWEIAERHDLSALRANKS